MHNVAAQVVLVYDWQRRIESVVDNENDRRGWGRGREIDSDKEKIQLKPSCP